MENKNIEKLFEIILSNNPSENIKKNEDFVFDVLPELKKCKGFNQNNIWHVYDVYNHILKVVDNVPNNKVLRITALFHDLGKPLSYTEDANGVGHFYNHWTKSKEIFDNFAKKYNFDAKFTELVSKLIYYHDVNFKKLNEQDFNLFISSFNKKEMKMLFEIKRSDLLAQNEKFHYVIDDIVEQENYIISTYYSNENEQI